MILFYLCLHSQAPPSTGRQGETLPLTCQPSLCAISAHGHLLSAFTVMEWSHPASAGSCDNGLADPCWTSISCTFCCLLCLWKYPILFAGCSPHLTFLTLKKEYIHIYIYSGGDGGLYSVKLVGEGVLEELEPREAAAAHIWKREYNLSIFGSGELLICLSPSCETVS